MSLLTPGRRPLLLPGTSKRQLRRPDARGLIVPAPSAMPLSGNEVDFDELDVLRTWRMYSDDAPGEVKYFCYELRQVDPAEGEETYFKAVRLIRLTRVPRYLRQAQNGSGHVFTQMRDVLVGLREKRVLFINLIAKSPQLPLVFAYGVQGTGDTIEEAMDIADEAYAALTVNLDGTYQQLEYSPLTFGEGELLARYQAEWGHIAMARGRPMPQGAGVGSSGIFDGNRTDVENTNNQLESFIRGMSNRSFMLSLVTVPLTPEDMTLAWHNMAQKASAARSDQQGSRGVAAGIAIPLGMGTTMGDSTGSSHGVTGTQGTGTSDGLSQSLAHGVTVAHTDGVNQAVSTSHTAGTSQSIADSQSTSAALGQSQTHTDGLNAGVSDSVGASLTNTQGQGVSVGTSHGLTNTQSLSDSQGVSTGQSLSHALSSGSNWASSAGKAASAGQTVADSWNKAFTDSLSQGWSVGNSNSSGSSQSGSTSQGSDLSGGLPILGGSQSVGSSLSQGINHGLGNNIGVSQTGGGSTSNGVSGSLSTNLGSSVNVGESAGGSLSATNTAAQSVGTSHSLTAGQSLAASDSQSASQSASLAQAQGQSLSHGQSLGTSSSLANGATLSQGVSQGQTATQGASQATTQGASQGTSSSDSLAASSTDTQGASSALSRQSALSDAWNVAMSRQASQSGSLGIVPTFTAQFSKATFDEAKRVVGDILTAQMERYQDGIEGGGMLYQMFLVTPDRPTLIGASSLLKSAFWGPGGQTQRLPSPFMTHVIDDEPEARRLLTHAGAFSTYRKREPASEIIEPYWYSTYVTTGEASAFCHPPTTEASGLQTQTDSMPVLYMPANRGERDIYLGHIVNGERGQVSDSRFGVDLNELTHILIQGVTGLGKTTTMMRLLEQVVRLEREVVDPPTPEQPWVRTRKVRAGMLVLDWMQNARKLANVVPADRFQLFSVAHPHLGAFRFNPLALPHEDMDPGQWLGAMADNLASSFGLGEYGRSIISEMIDALYSANRLETFTLRAAVIDEVTGTILRPAINLPAIDRASLPDEAVAVDGMGTPYANVYTYPQLSKLVGLPQLAVLVAAKVEEAATPEGARLYGTEMRNRLQSVWRRLQYYAPGNPLATMLRPDPSLEEPECLGVTDLIDTDRGLVTVIETDGLDLENRRVVLGSVMLAIYRYGLRNAAAGIYDQGGKGPGTFIVLEEAHELFGEATEGEDRVSATMRANLYESLFRRARQTGLRLVAMTQNCGQVPAAITSQTTTVIVHRTYDDADRKRVFSLLNWSNMINQQQREWRYLGEMPRGYAIVRLDARKSYLESAPVQILVDPPELPDVSDATLAALAKMQATRR